MDYQAFKQLVIAEVQAAGLKEYELYYQESVDMKVDVVKHEMSNFYSAACGGVCFRCMVDGKVGYSSTELFEEDEAKRIVRTAAENARFIENEDKVFFHTAGDHYQKTRVKPMDHPTAEEMIQSALTFHELLYQEDKRVNEGSENILCLTENKVSLCNSNGLDLENSTVGNLSYFSTQVQEGDVLYESFTVSTKAFSTIDQKKLTSEGVKKAIDTIGGKPVKTGDYKIILEPETAASFLQVFSGIFSSDCVQKGMSLLKDKLGEKIAADAVTIVDDPFYEDCYAQTSFDAEGVATFTKNVLEDGVLKNFLYNLKTAHKDGVMSTGNASKSGYAAGIDISPYSFYFKPGKHSQEELLEKAGDGILISNVTGLHAGASMESGDFSLVSKGFVIENGKKGRPVTNITIAGNFYEMLFDIIEIGSDLEFFLPQGYSNYGSPSIFVKSLKVSGE